MVEHRVRGTLEAGVLSRRTAVAQSRVGQECWEPEAPRRAVLHAGPEGRGRPAARTVLRSGRNALSELRGKVAQRTGPEAAQQEAQQAAIAAIKMADLAK